MTRQDLVSERCIHNLNVEWRANSGKPLDGLYRNCSAYLCSGRDREENPCDGFISLGEIVEGVCAYRINSRKLLRKDGGLNKRQEYCLRGCQAGYRSCDNNCDDYFGIDEHLQVEDVLIPNLVGDREIKSVIHLIIEKHSLSFRHSR